MVNVMLEIFDVFFFGVSSDVPGTRATVSEGSRPSACMREAFTGVQGAGPLMGVATFQRPHAWEICVFCKLNMHNFRPFLI